MDIDDIFDPDVDWSEVNADCDFCGLDDYPTEVMK